MANVLSTLANDQQFNVYDNQGRVTKSVIIAGGAGVQNKETLKTPQGMATEVDDDTLKILEADKSFARFVKREFFKVMKNRVDPEKASKDQNAGDKSKQATKKKVSKKLEVEGEQGEAESKVI